MPCVVLGALTHVVWDSFTHANGWVVQRVPFLTEEFGLPIFKLAQFGSGLFGCVAVLVYCLARPDAPPASGDTRRVTDREWVAALALLAAFPLVCGLAFALPAWSVRDADRERALHCRGPWRERTRARGMCRGGVVAPDGAATSRCPCCCGGGGGGGGGGRPRAGCLGSGDGTHHRHEHHGRPRRTARLRPAPPPHAASSPAARTGGRRPHR